MSSATGARRRRGRKRSSVVVAPWRNDQPPLVPALPDGRAPPVQQLRARDDAHHHQGSHHEAGRPATRGGLALHRVRAVRRAPGPGGVAPARSVARTGPASRARRGPHGRTSPVGAALRLHPDARGTDVPVGARPRRLHRDGPWWAVTTLTTVGFGDTSRVTPTGRLAPAVLVVGGIALLGVVTATLASWLVERVPRSGRSARWSSDQHAREEGACPSAQPACRGTLRGPIA